MEITEEIVAKLQKHGKKMILGIRGEDIKFVPHRMHFFDCETEEAIVL